MKFIDLFAGIGGVKIGFESAGFECVFSNDFDKNVKITFDANFSQGLILEDVCNIHTKELPDFDILCGGFPCQPFSVAGNLKGFNDVRGNLFFEIIRILKEKKPEVVFLENVKNVKTHENGQTLAKIYKELQDLGYHVTDKVMNTMDYGNIPQNRERIYIVGFLDKQKFKKFKFPEKIPLEKTIQDCLEKSVDDLYYYNNKPLFEHLKNEVISKNSIYQWRRKYVRENKSSVCPTLTANMGTGGHNVPIVIDDKGIRKLTPKECANFQGFPRSYILPNISNANLYKQFGNSVSIPVIQRIAENIKNIISK